MRLKQMDGPLAVHNGNNDILNSPKRINTLQNSNVTSSIYDNSTTNGTIGLTNADGVIEFSTTQNHHQGTPKKNLNSGTQKVRWCSSTVAAKNRELANNYANNYAINQQNNQQQQRLNINANLAAPVRTQRLDAYIVPSPDDSVLDFEEAQQSCSSTEATPQDEEKAFEVSDSESSDDGNNSNGPLPHPTRGIINPNYPGFQHLAHTLGFGTKPSSDTEDDYDCCEILSSENVDANSINNNNNNLEVGEEEILLDKFESVNRLDSVENIQKVFHEKSIDIDDCAGFNQNICDSESSGDSNNSDSSPQSVVRFNIKIEEKVLEDIVGDFRKEVEDELQRVSTVDSKDPLERQITRAVELELEEAVEKLQVINNFEPSALKYQIEPNVTEPFKKLSVSKIDQAEVLSEFELVKNKDSTTNFNMPLTADVLLASNQKPLQEKISDALLSDAQEMLPNVTNKEFLEFNLKTDSDKENLKSVGTMKKSELTRRDSNRELEEIECQIKKIKSDIDRSEDIEKFRKEDQTKDYKEKDEDSAVPRKKEKMGFHVKKRRDYNQQIGSLITFPRRELPKNRDPLNRRSVPMARERKKIPSEFSGGFDVYNIETAMPKIDLEAIECHLRAAREEERRRRTDREEIRRRLAMGSEDDYYTDRPGRKPSLQARLQSGMNLQICFMNETVSDTESPSSDSECPLTNPKQPKTTPKTAQNSFASRRDRSAEPATRPATLSLSQPIPQPLKESTAEADFFTRQARLQTEARMALAQAKEMARMQMEIERQRQKKSPITEMVRHSLEKVGIPFPEEKRRLSRQILTEMNVAQLQVIVNDLHTQIETLNENLVKFLMNRDDLHMEQDSMLVDIEDLTRYLGAKEQVVKGHNLLPTPQNNNMPPPSPAPSSPLATLNSTVKPHLHRIANLVKK